MDPMDLDASARSFAAPRSRRGLLGGLAALGAGILGLRAAGAAGLEGPKFRCDTDACAANQVVAGGPLRDLLTIAVDLGEPTVSAEFAPPAQRSLAFFANSAAQMAAVGVASPTPEDRDPATGAYTQDALTFWHWANDWMPFPNAIAGRTDVLIDTGWDTTRIDQSLQVGTGADGVAILRGRFDPDAMRTSWEQNGYEPVDIPDAVAYARPQTQESALDPSAQLNNVAVLGDGTLIVAARLDRLQFAVDAAAGRAPILLDRPAVATVLAALPTELAGAFLVPGDSLQQLVTAGGEALPPIELAVAGVTPGGPLPFTRQNDQGTPLPFRDDTPPARLAFALLFADEASATTAVSVIESRLATGDSQATRQPFAALFAAWIVRVVPGTPVVWIELTVQPDVPPKTWLLLVERGDLDFIAW